MTLHVTDFSQHRKTEISHHVRQYVFRIEMQGKRATTGTIFLRNTNEQYKNNFAQIHRIKKCRGTRQQTFQRFLSRNLLHKDPILRIR